MRIMKIPLLFSFAFLFFASACVARPPEPPPSQPPVVVASPEATTTPAEVVVAPAASITPVEKQAAAPPTAPAKPTVASTETPRPSVYATLNTYGGETKIADVTPERTKEIARRATKNLIEPNKHAGVNLLNFGNGQAGYDYYINPKTLGVSDGATTAELGKKAYFFEVASVEDKGENINGVPIFKVIFTAKNNRDNDVTITLNIRKTSKVWVTFPVPGPFTEVYELPGQTAESGMIKKGFMVGIRDEDGWLGDQVKEGKTSAQLGITREVVLLVR